jgi:hypothetical protein
MKAFTAACNSACAVPFAIHYSPHFDSMQGRMEFLRKDLEHLFDERGIDKSAYEEKVKFRDPLTRYNSVSGFAFNL